MLQTHCLGSFWKWGSDPVGLWRSFQSAFLRRRLRMYTVEDHTWSLEALERLGNTCVSDLPYQRCPNYWFKHKRWPLSRNQYAFSFKFRLGEFVWQPGKAEGCCVGRNEAHYLQTKTGVNVHRCVPMAFWGCLKSKEQEAREENAVTCFMQMKHRHTLYLSVAGTTSYNTVFWTASSFTLMLWFRASWRRNRL